MIEWRKDCDCMGPSSSGQMWTTCERNGDTVTLVMHYEPRMACETCKRPWRIVTPAQPPAVELVRP